MPPEMPNMSKEEQAIAAETKAQEYLRQEEEAHEGTAEVRLGREKETAADVEALKKNPLAGASEEELDEFFGNVKEEEKKEESN